MSGIAQPRPAATVVVVRPHGDRFEVLLVRRNDRVAFMAGAYVFPGGRVDDEDRAGSVGGRFLQEPQRFADLPPVEELPFRRAAVRELREEAAVTVDLDELLPIGHWVTPEIEIRRYDTRFYLTVMPAGQAARHDDSELTALVWSSPAAALDDCRRGAIMLPPPTWTTLRQLERHRTLADVLDWARMVTVVRIRPEFVRNGTTRILTLPGDPTFPAVPGWTVPEETRFVLEEGRGWLPVRT